MATNKLGRLLMVLTLTLGLVWSVSGYTVGITADGSTSCRGIHGRDFGLSKSKNGTITALFTSLKDSQSHRLSVLIFNYLDAALTLDPDTYQPSICGERDTIKKGECSREDLDKWIVRNGPKHSEIMSVIVDSRNTTQVSYDVQESGLYCISILPSNMQAGDFDVPVEVTNPYGKMPAIEYPKLVFYGLLSIVYLLIGIAWVGFSFKYWHDILPVQNYVGGLAIMLTLEMAFNYGYFEDYNRWGRSSTALLVCVAVINAARTSLSFFLLLIVGLGYGVVRPSLGDTMKRVVALTAVHFVFGVAYAASTLLVTDVSFSVFFFCVLPLSGLMSVFYFWIIKAIKESMTHLENRRQVWKLQMYKNLKSILGGSLLVILGMFVIDTFYFMNFDSPDWLPTHWQWWWFMLDGWLNLLYLGVFVGIAILWRPTENNQRYGLEELAQDDDGLDRMDDESGLGQDISLQKVVVDNDERDDQNGTPPHDNDDDVLEWMSENVDDRDERNGRRKD
ncbi:hypothetical protein HDU85_004150 [Gaertneriomyces sp. JEL0708]|nr:hypothetical protein HDU85_004150 [Gaertneriomyces sp. JEL0708]